MDSGHDDSMDETMEDFQGGDPEIDAIPLVAFHPVIGMVEIKHSEGPTVKSRDGSPIGIAADVKRARKFLNHMSS